MLGCSGPTLREHAVQGKTMGTTYTVKFVEQEGLNIVIPALKVKIDDALIEVNALMSTYDPESELSRLNRAQDNEAFSISPETEVVLLEAMRLGRFSDGRLDVTVGPLVNLWGFGPDKRPELIPSDEELQAIREYVGLDKFTVADGTVTKQHSNVYIDLSTIAKGYGVDVLAELLEAQGIENYLVEIGGEMRVKGTKLNNKPWRIAIEKPIEGKRNAQIGVVIGDNAIATSGDYRNYFEVDGKRFSHLIDPATGFPIKHNLVSVSVIHPSSMTADGLATALNVMGPDDAKRLAERNDLAVYMVIKEGEEFVEYASPAFDKQVQYL
ncbi:FAD:protein FMN transferase [Glaciecola sp. MH2013]|uniref:FAD:protein FMN transferase n=1 Tax=Glaciecola sp. MH2013 TaxID=2785524 RepID=UPI00189E68E3|nr:FAD:protein FMN transferase [Glaciecola sp. MH2013]